MARAVTGALALLVCVLAAQGEPLTAEKIRQHRMLLEGIVKMDVNAVRKALDDGADPNRVIGKFSPLETAALTGEIEIVKLLVERGADPATRMTDGTPIHEWATKFGNNDRDSPATQIGAYLKARIAGQPDPEPVKPTDEELADAKLDDGVVLMPEAVLKATPVETPDLSAYNNVPVPAGWKAFRAEKEKAWILSNGLDDARAVRIILADPTEAPESLNRVRSELESGLRGYVQLCGVVTTKHFDMTTSITTYPSGTLSVSADVMAREKSKVVGAFELDGKMRDKKYYAVLLHRGPSEETLKALSLYSDFRMAALRDPR